MPARLIKLFTFGAAGDFPGEIVADPFCGTGTTCVAAKRMGRRWIGIDCVKSYVTTARVSIARAEADGGMDLRIGTHWRPRIDEPDAAVSLFPASRVVRVPTTQAV